MTKEEEVAIFLLPTHHGAAPSQSGKSLCRDRRRRRHAHRHPLSAFVTGSAHLEATAEETWQRRARCCGWRSGRRLVGLLEEDVARSLGVNLNAMRLRLALGLALGVGSVVAVTGVIGFVGLVAPHLVRPFTGHLPSRSLVAAGLLGAVILVLADGFIRVIPTQTELKMGVVTAFLGVPMLLYLIRRTV